VAGGDVLVVRGPSGCGKTCLLRLLAWLDAPDEGRVTLGERGPADIGAPWWRRRVAYVPQTPPALQGTPAEFLARVGTFRTGNARRDPVGIAEGWGLPPSTWDQPWSRLSGGERQRALLALGLCGDPEVLLLDEPTSALDDEATAAVEATLSGRTAVWVTHDAAQADRVATNVLELGTP